MAHHELAERQTVTAIPAGTWSVDPIHSTIEFVVDAMGLVDVRGYFSDFEGTIEADSAGFCAQGVVKVDSISTRHQPRDESLHSDEFFGANHPEISFASREVRRRDLDAPLEIVGDLTMRGQTETITLEAMIAGTASDPWGSERLGLHASTEIDRRDFGLHYDERIPSGEPLVSNEVRIELNLNLVKTE